MRRSLPPILAAAALIAITAYLATTLTRLSHPFELEWQEGGTLDHVQRVIDGEDLYAEPTLEFMAFPYTPLYYWVAALATKVVGDDGFLPLRLVSLFASLVVLAILYDWGRRADGPLAGLACAGLFAATWDFAGAWYDVARVDSLSLAFVFVGLWLARWRRGARVAAIAGALFALGFLTKQTAFGVALPVGVAVLVRDRREGLAFLGTFAGLALASGLALDATSDGWFRFYCFELLAGHGWFAPKVLGFWSEDMSRFALLLALLIVASTRRTPPTDDEEAPQRDLVLPLAIAGLVATAWIGRAHTGGAENTLIPACAAAALLFGPAATRTLALGGPPAKLGAFLAVAQLAMFAYDPRDRIPTDVDRAAGVQLLLELEAVEGEVFVPHHGYLAERAGSRGSAHWMTIVDLLTSEEVGTAERFVALLEADLAARRWAVVVLDEERPDLKALDAHYALVRRIGDPDPAVFRPVTGAPRRPELWYEPR